HVISSHHVCCSETLSLALSTPLTLCRTLADRPSSVFFLIEPATPEIYTLSLHDALPICWAASRMRMRNSSSVNREWGRRSPRARSEEHTSELQSRENLVCRLLLEKKKNI